MKRFYFEMPNRKENSEVFWFQMLRFGVQYNAAIVLKVATQNWCRKILSEVYIHTYILC